MDGTLVDNMLRGYARQMRDEIAYSFRVGPPDAYDSPLEQALAVAFEIKIRMEWPRLLFASSHGFEDLAVKKLIGMSDEVDGIIAPQVKIGTYRVDFFCGHIAGLGDGVSGIVVEVDGHDFHDRTKEQARRDKTRDRTLQSCGYKVFRFAGSEVWKDAFACAETVLVEMLQMIMLADHVRDLMAIGKTEEASSRLAVGRL